MAQPFLVRNLKKLLLISIVLQCLCILFLSWNYMERMRSRERETEELADRLMKKMEFELQNNADCMNQTVALRSDYRTMFAQDDYEMVTKISELQMIYDLRGLMTDVPYNYFIYDIRDNKYIELTTVQRPFSEYRDIRETIKKQWSDGNCENGRWYLTETASGSVVSSGWRYMDFVLGTWTSEEDFLSGLNTINWGQNGKAELIKGKKEADEKANVIKFTLSN